MRERPGWQPRDYRDSIYDVLDGHPTYGAMALEGNHCRCVRVRYSEMHVDLVPFVTLSSGRKIIVDADKSDWEDSNPERFSQWLLDKDTVAERNLRRVIRLMKFSRDHWNSFTGTKSVLITVMLGMQVDRSLKLTDPGLYSSVPRTRCST
jgi:hypothetical protein